MNKFEHQQLLDEALEQVRAEHQQELQKLKVQHEQELQNLREQHGNSIAGRMSAMLDEFVRDIVRQEIRKGQALRNRIREEVLDNLYLEINHWYDSYEPNAEPSHEIDINWSTKGDDLD